MEGPLLMILLRSIAPSSDTLHLPVLFSSKIWLFSEERVTY